MTLRQFNLQYRLLECKQRILDAVAINFKGERLELAAIDPSEQRIIVLPRHAHSYPLE